MSDDREDTVGNRGFVARWAAAGPALAAQRYAELRALTDDDARRMMHDVFAHWHPSATDEFGAELVAQQRFFRAAARAERS